MTEDQTEVQMLGIHQYRGGCQIENPYNVRIWLTNGIHPITGRVTCAWSIKTPR